MVDNVNSSANGAELIPFSVGIISTGFFTLPLQVAKATGSMKKFGLALEVVDTHGESPVDLLKSGDIQVGAVPPEGIIKRIESEKSDIQIIAGNTGKLILDRHSPDSLLVRGNHTTVPPSRERDYFRGRLTT
jgi:ABC-type nitrate/sulfonate/bicarbonate transport system substrate-binding protein